MLKKLFVLALSFSAASAAFAQDHQPLEKAQQAARTITEKTPALDNPQIKVDIDIQKPYLVTGGDNLGVLVVPDKTLANKKPLPDGKDVIPLGQLWMRGLAPFIDGAAVANDKLRELTLAADGDQVDLTAYLLAAKTDGDQATLLIYGKAKEPVATLPLKKGKNYQDLPLELDAIGDGDSATLSINVAGIYIAKLKLTRK